MHPIDHEFRGSCGSYECGAFGYFFGSTLVSAPHNPRTQHLLHKGSLQEESLKKQGGIMQRHDVSEVCAPYFNSWYAFEHIQGESRWRIYFCDIEFKSCTTNLSSFFEVSSYKLIVIGTIKRQPQPLPKKRHTLAPRIAPTYLMDKPTKSPSLRTTTQQ